MLHFARHQAVDPGFGPSPVRRLTNTRTKPRI
jgi:hypothetical protein